MFLHIIIYIAERVTKRRSSFPLPKEMGSGVASAPSQLWSKFGPRGSRKWAVCWLLVSQDKAAKVHFLDLVNCGHPIHL